MIVLFPQAVCVQDYCPRPSLRGTGKVRELWSWKSCHDN